MLDSWILSKLDPLRERPVIVLRDPQRMLVSGARAVDGWAEENGFSVLFCTGNLALREMYEAVREDRQVKVLLVDRSRKGSLFYPDLQVRAGEGGLVFLSLRSFLIEQTGDPAWPKLLDDQRQLSAVLLEDLPATIEAYRHLRRAAPSRFTDSDLYKIALGAALKINPFKNLSAGDIRRLCIEQHSRLEDLKTRLPGEVMDALVREIARGPKPFCWLLERDPALVMRAFTLAAILRQHKLDYQLLMANVDPLLHDYKDIDPDFLDQAIGDQLAADPDQVLEDVRLVEDALRRDPAALALVLRDQMQIDRPENALEVLKAERLSGLIRGLALASLLVDLILKHDLKFHRSVLDVLEQQERDPALPALRRPGEQWLALTAAYRRAVSVFGLTVVLAKTASQLKVAGASELNFEFFDQAWNERRLNRLDFYLSDLERVLRVGDILPLPLSALWDEMAQRWTDARRAFQRTLAAAEKAQQIVNTRFQDFYRLHYTKWLNRSDIPLIFTHQFLPRLLKRFWEPQSGQKAVVLVFDGLRTDAWDEFLRPVLEERWALLHSQPGSALLPTETELSRKAISAGKLPADFSTGRRRESDLLKAWLEENYGWAPNFQIVRDDDTEASGMVVRYASPQIEYIVFNFTDENLHHNQNELALIYGSVVREIVQQDVRSVLRELPEDALIFVTSDHGFIPMPQAALRLPENAALDDHDIKYRCARTVQKLAPPESDQCVEFDVRAMGIPNTSPSVRDTPFNYVLFPRPEVIFKRRRGPHDPDRYAHGGLSLAECLVPMAVFGPRPSAQRLLNIASLRQVGSASEGESLELEIEIQAGQMFAGETTFTLSFNRPEIAARKEVFSGLSKTYRVRWTPSLGELTPEARQRGVVDLPVSVLLSYREGDQPVRTSQGIDVHIKLDTTRLRRRLDSKLDLLMGRVPKELKS